MKSVLVIVLNTRYDILHITKKSRKRMVVMKRLCQCIDAGISPKNVSALIACKSNTMYSPHSFTLLRLFLRDSGHSNLAVCLNAENIDHYKVWCNSRYSKPIDESSIMINQVTFDLGIKLLADQSKQNSMRSRADYRRRTRRTPSRNNDNDCETIEFEGRQSLERKITQAKKQMKAILVEALVKIDEVIDGIF